MAWARADRHDGQGRDLERRVTGPWRAPLLLAALLSPVAAAAAPGISGDDPPLVNQAVAGVAGVLNRFQLDARVDMLYDGNLLRIGDGFALEQGQSRADYRISPALSAGTQLPFGRQTFFVNALIGRDFYGSNTQRNRNRLSFDGGLNWQLGGRCNGGLTGAYSSRQVLLSTDSGLTPNVQDNLSFAFNGRCQSAGGLGIGFGVSHNQVNNDQVERKAYDARTNSFEPSLYYGTPQLGQFSLSGSYSRSDYPNRTVLTLDGPQGDRVDFLSGRLGYARGLGSKLSVAGGISYLKVTPKPDSALIQPGPGEPFVLIRRDGGDNLGYDFSLSYDSGSRLTGAVLVSRRNSASTNVGAQSRLIQEYAGDIGYKLSRALQLGGNVSYAQQDYSGSFFNGNEPLRRISDKTFRASVSVDYSPVALYSVGVSFGHQERNSNPSDYSFASNSVQLRLRVGFGK